MRLGVYGVGAVFPLAYQSLSGVSLIGSPSHAKEDRCQSQFSALGVVGAPVKLQRWHGAPRQLCVGSSTPEFGTKNIPGFRSSPSRDCCLEKRFSSCHLFSHQPWMSVMSFPDDLSDILPLLPGTGVTKRLPVFGHIVFVEIKMLQDRRYRLVVYDQYQGRTRKRFGADGLVTEEEVELAKDEGFIPIKLGQRILRTETAAITLMGILQYELGDL